MGEFDGLGHEIDRPLTRTEEFDDGLLDSLRLGQDVRFLLVTVGGGAARIGRVVAGRHLRYLETVSINCDPTVEDADEFDRRVCLAAPGGEERGTDGSSAVGNQRARAASAALDRIFEGATFVTIVASLGGGTGTGALPAVLEAACRASEIVSLFVVKPFVCEGHRRSLADRALGRLHFVEPFVEKQQRGLATVRVLDNETFAHDAGRIAFAAVNRQWADAVAAQIERDYLVPAETTIEAGRMAAVVEHEMPGRPGPLDPATMPAPPPPFAPPALLRPYGPGAAGLSADIELTFEVDPPKPAPDAL
jgi:hypothetical protein